jgi:photosystem II stability/assembly factor-like uncharacterized protein
LKSSVFALAVVAGLAWSGAHAQQGGTIDPSIYSGMKWRSIGPDRGGRSIAVAGSAARPNEYFFGAVGGGVWKSDDYGNSWAPVSDKDFKTSSVGALAVAPSNPDVVYAGMGESCFRGNILQGDGIYKSTDAGKTWTHSGLANTETVSKIRVHPNNPDLVYAAVLGHAYGPNPERGVFRSKDGGKNWERVLFRNNETGAIDLSIDPKNPDVLYATLWQVYRTPHSMESGGPGSGLFKSTDGGSNWTDITKNPGLPTGLWGRSGVSVSGADSNRVYAIIENDNGGVYVSDDAGATWKAGDQDRKLRQRAFYYTHITADPQNKDRVYVLNVQFWRSDDGGKTFPTQIRPPHGDNHDLWIAPNDNNRMVQGNDGGGNVSVNAGRTWTGQGYATSQFYNVFLTKHVPYHVCGAQQDNSTACVGSEANPGAGEGSLPPIFYSPGGGESGYIASDPTNPDIFFAGSYGGLMTRLDRSTDQRRIVTIYPNNPMGHSSEDIKERFQWTYPIVYSPIDPKILYASSQHLFMTTNGGQSWTKISPDLTRADKATMGPSGGPITKDQTGVETYATIFTIAPSQQDLNTIWTGSDDGYVYITRDGGKNWAKVNPPDMPDFTRISLIEASPHQNGVAYLVGNRYQRDDRKPYVYKTSDFGKTWTKIVNGLPDNDFPRAIREDVKRRGLLFLGMENGMYLSFDDGASWQSLRLNLPVTPVHGIASHERDLVIGTHGRGFYILDDIGVLRQATPQLTTSTLHVFDIQDPLRGFDRNVAFDYFLGKDAEEVKIEILDSSGTVLRTFTGTPKDKEPERPESDFGPQPPPRVGVKKGMNRFAWDLRQEGAVVFPGLIMWAAQPARGPASPPGKYSVRISALGETQSKPFAIGLDSRLKAKGVTEADLQEQFKLSTQVRDKVSAANNAVLQIRSIREQVAERLAKVPERRRKEIQAIADGLMKPLTAVEEEVYQVKNRSGQDPLNFPIKLNNKIAALSGVIEASDNKPTDQSYEVYKELSDLLDKQLTQRDALLKAELQRLNAALKRERLEAVDPNKKPAPPAKPVAPTPQLAR